MPRFKKIFFIFSGTIILMAIVLILLSSPISKYLIEKHDQKYTGRNITIDWSYVNPFTGYIYLSNIKIFEQDSLSSELTGDSVCLSAKSLSINMAMLKLFFKTYEISELTLNQPRGILIQKEKNLNISDLIERFSAKDSTRAPVHFNILGLKIIDGEFQYREELIPINYSIKEVNFESTGKRWNADTIAAQFSFIQGIGKGTVKGNFTINTKSKDYRYAAVVHEFDLHIIQQYLKDLTNYGSFSANLEANIKSTGNLRDQEDVTSTGMLAIRDFHLGKKPDDDYLSFDKFGLTIIELSPKNHKYFYDSVSLTNPYLKYERYDSLDNFQRMFGRDGSNLTNANANPAKFNLIIELARYIKVLSRNFFNSDYKIKRLAITNADLKFNDFSINEKFSVDLNPLYITADSIDKDHNRVNIVAQSGIKPYGKLSLALSINPKDSSDFDMQYHLQGLPASLFNPYAITHTSFSFDRGTLELKGKWHVRNGIIKSSNHLSLLDPRTAKRVKTKDTKWVPLPLIMTFIRERGNAVDYEIPITGNLKDPKFHLGDVFQDLVTNIFTKPPTTASGLQIKNIEAEIEKSLTLTWPLRNSSISSDQEAFIERMVDFLKENPEASIVIHPEHYAIKEKEYILYFEAKKKYFLQQKRKGDFSFSEDNSDEVEKMFIKSSSFVQYLENEINDSTVFTIPGQCSMLIHSKVLDTKFEKLNKEREKAFLSYFKKEKVESQIRFSEEVNVIPYNGFSFYKIEYKGEFPKSIMKAYRQMQELNNEAPRKKYKEERIKIVSAL